MSGKFIIVPRRRVDRGRACAGATGRHRDGGQPGERKHAARRGDRQARRRRPCNHKERIHTSSSGSAQLLFLDKSTLSIAPNTSLVIDEFVYDPAANRGHMLTRLTQGTLQYIGGQLSHQGAVTINTPAVAVGIRGGTVTITHGANGTQITNQYGTITLTNAAGTTIVTQPGYTVSVANRNTPPGQPMRVTADEVRRNIKKLSSQFGQDGGVRGLKRIDTARLNCATRSACPEQPWPSAAENDAAQIIVQSTQRATLPTPPRVIRGD